MNNWVHQILDQISALENELHTAIEQQEARLRYRIKDISRTAWEKADRRILYRRRRYKLFPTNNTSPVTVNAFHAA